MSVFEYASVFHMNLKQESRVFDAVFIVAAMIHSCIWCTEYALFANHIRYSLPK